MKKLEVVQGLKNGNCILNSGDEIIFKLKNESKLYKANLYDIGENSFTAYGDDGIEYNILYNDIEEIKDYEPEIVTVKIITGKAWYKDEVGKVYSVDKGNIIYLDEECFQVINNDVATRKCIACFDCEEIY